MRQCLKWLCALILFLDRVDAQTNVTLENTASAITYTPSICNGTLAANGTSCDAAWQILSLPEASGGNVTSTSGPTPDSFDVLPQLFLRFQALALYIRTSSLSNALMNVTLRTQNPVLSVSSQVNSSVDLVTVINLPEDTITTLVLTYITSDKPTRLDIDSLTITLSENNTSPTVTGAPSISVALPTVIQSASPAGISGQVADQNSANSRQTSGDIAAEVLGSILGVFLIIAVGVIRIRYRRRQQWRQQSVT